MYEKDIQAYLSMRRRRQRRVMLIVVLPSALLILLVAVLLGLFLAGTLSQQQIGVMAGCLVVPFVLLPLAILMILPSGLMLFVALGSKKLQGLIQRPMHLLQSYSQKTASYSHLASERITGPVINLQARAARWRAGFNTAIGFPQDTGEQINEPPG